jgi:alpha-mannosidase
VPAVGFAVFDAIASDAPCAIETGVHAEGAELGNRRSRARLDDEGNLASLFDRVLGRELLAGPAVLELLADRSTKFPAWEILYDDLRAAPREQVGAPADVRVVESGPARASLEVTRRVGSSLFRQRLSLAAGGAGDRLEIACFVDWRARGRLLKARFTPNLDGPTATYDLGIGAIERGIDTPDLYEVPGQQWADLSCSDRGVAILNDGKYGWDRPDASTLRLTLLHTPAIGLRFRYQKGLDRGRHRFTYAIAGHAGDWRAGDVAFQAARLNQPLRAFRCAAHSGPLGRSWSFLRVEPDRIAATALKLSESGEEFIVRLQEQHGRETASAHVSAAAPVASARFVNGVEEPRPGSIEIDAREFRASIMAFSPSAIAFCLPPPPVRLAPAAQEPVDLPLDRCVVTFDGDRTAGDFDGRGRSLPGELLSSEIDAFGVRFRLGPLSTGTANAVVCRGQSVPIRAKPGACLHLLAASAGEDVACEVAIDGRSRSIRVPSWSALLGRADRRRFGRLRGGFFRAENIAWVGTHRHNPSGDEPYFFCSLYRVTLVLDEGATSIELPRDPRVRLLAATIAENVADDAETITPFP